MVTKIEKENELLFYVCAMFNKSYPKQLLKYI